MTAKLLQQEQITALEESIQADIKQAFEFAEQSPFPDPEQLSKHLMAGEV